MAIEARGEILQPLGRILLEIERCKRELARKNQMPAIFVPEVCLSTDASLHLPSLQTT
jgi:hypothetical protein